MSIVSKPEECLYCGSPEFSIARDMIGTRKCSICGRSWVPAGTIGKPAWVEPAKKKRTAVNSIIETLEPFSEADRKTILDFVDLSFKMFQPAKEEAE